MWVVGMMLRVVLSVVLWVVLSVVMPIYGFVVIMLVVMHLFVFTMLWVGLMMLRVIRMIDNGEYMKLQGKIEDITDLFFDIIQGFQDKAQSVVLMMLGDQMIMKKMARVRDDLTKLQERLEMGYRKLEYADEEMMIVPYDTTNTLFHNLRGLSHDLQDFSDELLKHEDTLASTLVKDTENLVEKLMITHRSPGVHVYGIVGERGIGKTTLARKIFNHQTIKDKFRSPPPIWVDVHMNSTFHTIAKSIIDKFGGDSKWMISPSELKNTLNELFREKEILVVLDEVHDSKEKERIVDCLENVDCITNFLVTTRNESVITHEGIYKHKLPLLSEEDGWALMCKLLFNDGEKGNMQHFEQIGKNMVNKCHGLPLSIKTIARILNAKEKIHSEWGKVLENISVSLEPSNKTLPKLVYLLPYENLSPYIKQCFIFCAFFPDDYIFEKNILIQQWVVAGLVKKPSMSTEKEKGEMQLLEDVANDHYMELLESNILQSAAECLYYDNKAMCRMHGSMRSFGQHLIQNSGYFQGDVKALEEVATSPSSSSVPKLHHLVITNLAPLNEFPKIVKKQTSVRTLVFTSKLEITNLPKDLFQKLKLLRILDISGSNCRVLPKSLFKLLHLRHLNLSCLPIKTLPDAIGNLINLQHLILRYCGSLLDLPTSITRLHKLRSIDLHQTPLMGMPIWKGKLSQLTSLIGFVASDYNAFQNIRALMELRTLNIVDLEVFHVLNTWVLEYQTNLIDLTLSCRGEGQPYEEDKKKQMQNCFEYLRPCSTVIQHIKINGYFGLRFPKWIMDLPFFKLKSLELLKCKYCPELPSLGGLPLLEHVRVKDAWSIKHINLGAGPGSNLPSLKSLILKDMPVWEEWTWEPHRFHSVMPVLQLLEIINCPKLKSLPQSLPYHAKSLATLTIYKAHNLEKIEGFASLKAATFISNHNLSIISDLPATCNFEIDDCPLWTHAQDSMQYS